MSSLATALIAYLRRSKPNFQNLQIIARQSAKTNQQTGDIEPDTLDESVFFSHLIEDGAPAPKPEDEAASAAAAAANKKDKKVAPNTMSYIDFLCWIHKRIQN